MASYRNVVLIALIFLIATPLRAHGVVISGIAKVQVVGAVSCGVPGTLPILGSLPLPGVSVNITCNGGDVILGTAVTSPAGFLNATVNVPVDLYFDSVVANVKLSGIASARCSVPPTTGILRVSLILVSVVQGVALFVTGPILT